MTTSYARLMRRQAVRYVVISQLIFAATIIMCGILRPSVIVHNGAFSSFGTQMPTGPIFATGLVAMATTLLYAARSLPKSKSSDTNHGLGRLFTIFAVQLAGIAITPFSINRAFYIIHISIGISLGVTFLIASVWLIRKSHRDGINIGLLCTQIAAIVIGELSTSEFPVFHLLASAQLVTILAFSTLLIRSVAQIEHVSVSL